MRGISTRLLFAAVLLFAACQTGPKFEGVAIDPPRDMPRASVTLPDSSRYSLGAVPGSPLVLFFGYTHCPDVCPTTLADWKRVKERLGAKASAVRFVFVTVDPERDTPDVALRYARQYDADFVGLSPDASTMSALLTAYGVAAAKEDGSAASGYLVSHSSQVFLVNGDGQLVALYPFGTRWEALAADISSLL